jgi:hypothetical protein
MVSLFGPFFSPSNLTRLRGSRGSLSFQDFYQNPPALFGGCLHQKKPKLISQPKTRMGRYFGVKINFYNVALKSLAIWKKMKKKHCANLAVPVVPLTVFLFTGGMLKY